jgi:protein TonB
MSLRALLGSTLVHALVVWLLFWFAPPHKFKAAPHAIQVALVNLPSGGMLPGRGEPTAAPAPPSPESEKSVRKVVESDRPEKNAVRPPDTKRPVPSRPRAGLPEGMRTETAPLGVPGLAGDVAVDDANFEFTYYLLAVRNRVSQNWGAPAGIVTQGEKIRSVVYFKIDRLGRLSDVKLTESSGVPFFDESALRAIRVSSPLPPLPAGFEGSHLGVHFGFQYTDR